MRSRIAVAASTAAWSFVVATLIACGSESGGSATAAAPPPAPPAQSVAPTADRASGTVPAASPGASSWLARYDFALEVDGRPSQDACFYQEASGRRLLVSAPELSQVCILNQEGKIVTAIDRDRLQVEHEGESARLEPGSDAGAESSGYNLDGVSVVFYLGPRRLKIVPKQALIGAATLDAILRHSPLYRKGAAAYTPDPAHTAYIRSWKSPLEIEVFFGTWCPHCKVLVPKFIRTMESAGNAGIRITYHGVPNGFANYEPARAKALKGVPTFIFMQSGREVGRIYGEPVGGTIEQAIADLLKGLPQ